VGHGLGSEGPTNAATGNRGIYGLYDEAYRRAADQIQSRAAASPELYPAWHQDVLPRSVQSVAWEAIRKLFNNKSKPNQTFATDQWNQVGNGAIDADTARKAIIERHGGYGY
jgi:hypothetical protein